MGQTSLPVLKRSGYYSFWDKSWDNQFKYQSFLIKFLYLESFFLKFFKSRFFLKKLLILKKNRQKKIYFFKNFTAKPIKNLKKGLSKLDAQVCTSKIWILKYQNWLVLNMYIYFPSVRFKKKLFLFNELTPHSNTEILFSKFNLSKVRGPYRKYSWFRRKIRYKSYKRKLFFTTRCFFKNSMGVKEVTTSAKPFKKKKKLKRLKTTKKFLKKKLKVFNFNEGLFTKKLKKFTLQYTLFN